MKLSLRNSEQRERVLPGQSNYLSQCSKRALMRMTKTRAAATPALMRMTRNPTQIMTATREVKLVWISNQTHQPGNSCLFMPWKFVNSLFSAFRVPPDPLECAICGHKALDSEDLHLHQAQHSLNECNVCVVTLKSELHFIRHLSSRVHKIGIKTRRWVHN